MFFKMKTPSISNQAKKIVFLLFTLFPLFAISQKNGFIRGTIYDGESGNPMPFVKVIIVGTTKVAISDLDGTFSIETAPGVFSIRLTFTGFETLIVENITVAAGEPTLLTELNMQSANTTLGTVVINAERREKTEVAMLTKKRESSNQIDGISGAAIATTGDGDASSAMSRVPGVSIAGGKYVYIRGLGDRYNKTLLNGMDIPGLDPDRNSIQMDLFPTNILDNIVVNKTFIASLPADFAGGVIDISLKSFPDKQQRNFSISGGYNPSFHFNQNYLTYQGGSLDFLGFDDGTRAIPATSNIPFFAQAVGNAENAERYKEILSNFNPTMAAIQKMSLMDYSLSTSFGNQFNKKGYTIGYNVLASYKSSTEYFKDVEFGRYGLAGSADSTAMQTRELQTGSYGTNAVLMTGMAGFAIKTQKSKYTFNLLHLQNGESKAGIFDYYNSDQGAIFQGFQHNLEYSQRQLTNLFISGKHQIDSAKWELEWKLSPTLSLIKDPDIRFTRYEQRNDSLIIGTEAGFPERIWRDLNEKNIASKIGAKHNYKAFGRKAILEFGGGYTYKTRDFNIRNFALNIRNVNLTGNPDELFADENIWPINGDVTKGTTYEASFLPTNPNKYNSNVHNFSGYVSTDVSPWKRIKAILGVRLESYTQRYTGQDQLGVNVFDNRIVIQDLNLFPSANLVYAITEKQNLRFSYGRTTVRPSFKELSYAEIYDPVTGRTFIGGLFTDTDANTGKIYWDGKLASTDIHNFDVRWETFPTNNQTVSITGFYKKFYNPIEIVQFAAQAGSFQPRNVGDGEVLGAELEIRQGFKFLSKKLENFQFTMNVTYTSSRILYSSTEKESRLANARTGQLIGDYREMAGQAPYLINAGFIYAGGSKGFWKGFETGVFYNVQGQTLQFVGIVDRPDIYSVPFHSLNLNANKAFGKDEKYMLSFNVKNLLNDKMEAVYKSFNAEDKYFSKLSPGATFTVKFRCNF
jgi:hypothetical protein